MVRCYPKFEKSNSTPKVMKIVFRRLPKEKGDIMKSKIIQKLRVLIPKKWTTLSQ